jgi:type IV secretion system protein VirB3
MWDGEVRIKIHRALTRPHLIMGGDRELVLAHLLVCAILIGVVLSWYGVIVGFMLAGIGLPLYRRLAKADVDMRRIYLRHIRYRLSYGARSTPWRTL